MDKATHELINLINILIKFNDNVPNLIDQFPDSEIDIDLIIPYIDYEIKKTLKDIIHIEKL